MNEIDIPNYRKVNHYDLENDYNNIVSFLKNKQNIPPGLNARQKARFIEKYSEFEMKNNRLFYKGLEIVQKNDIKETLNKIYVPSEGLGRGINSFYLLVQSKYLNITKSEVADFLRNQATYQLTFRPKPNIKKPTMKYNKPNIMWSMDLIDIHRYAGHNTQHKFILTIIDNFDKRVWLCGLKNKEAHAITNKLRPILERENPKAINLDNGGEFSKDNIPLFQEFGIKIVRSKSHVPISIIENLNGQVRKHLSQIFVHTGKLNWVNHLADIEENMNNFNALPKNVLKREQEVKERKENPPARPEPKFKVGDYVRILQSANDNKIRQEIKQHQQKYINVKYSIRLYKIYKTYKPRGNNSLPYYELIDVELNAIIGDTANKDKRRVFREIDLQKVPAKISDGFMLTFEENKKLNETKKKRDI